MAYKESKSSATLPNGRSRKGVPKFEDWFAQIRIKEHLSSPAWRSLTKTATDICIAAIAKQGRAGAMSAKFGGRPIFNFTVTEGVRLIGVSRTTFSKAIKELIRIGFLELVSPGGIIGGKGRAAEYSIGKGWKEWKPLKRDNRNIMKARSMRRGALKLSEPE